MCWLTAARTAANTGPQPAPQGLACHSGTQKKKGERRKREWWEKKRGLQEEVVTYSQATESPHLSAANNELNHTASVQRGQSFGLSHSILTSQSSTPLGFFYSFLETWHFYFTFLDLYPCWMTTDILSFGHRVRQDSQLKYGL